MSRKKIGELEGFLLSPFNQKDFGLFFSGGVTKDRQGTALSLGDVYKHILYFNHVIDWLPGPGRWTLPLARDKNMPKKQSVPLITNAIFTLLRKGG